MAMDDVKVPVPLAEALMDAFFGTADWMRNREG
jgi:hemoglobin